jgi:hypothetical protein
MTASRDESRSQPSAVARIPFSLKIGALGFFLLGAALIADAIALLLTVGIVSSAVTLLSALFVLLIARGLLRLRSAARKWAIFVSWGFLVVYSAGAVFITVDPSASLGFFGTNIHRPDDWRMLLVLAMLSYVGWQCYVLHSRALRRLFTTVWREPAASAVATPHGRRFQFGLKKVFVVTFLTAVVFARLSVLLYVPHATSMAISQSASGGVRIDYGYQSHLLLNVPDKLDYVVFGDTDDKRRFRSNALRVSTGYGPRGLEWVSLCKPDGTDVDLPNEVQLYECIDGKYRESRERVEKREFDAWLASNPGEYSIGALLEYVKSHPKREQ